VGGSASTSTSTPYIRVQSWFKSHPPRSPFRADLGLESPSYFYSCPFVFIRGSKHPSRSAFRTDLRLVSSSYIYSWFIRVHSWFKKRFLAIIRENPCSSVAKKTPVAPHPRTPVRGSPDEHTPRVTASRESQRSQTTSTDSVTSVASVVQKTFLAKTRRKTQAAAVGGSASTSTSTPYIRVHSWFKTPLAKSLQGRSRAGKPKLLLFVFHSC